MPITSGVVEATIRRWRSFSTKISNCPRYVTTQNLAITIYVTREEIAGSERIPEINRTVAFVDYIEILPEGITGVRRTLLSVNSRSDGINDLADQLIIIDDGLSS